MNEHGNRTRRKRFRLVALFLPFSVVERYARVFRRACLPLQGVRLTDSRTQDVVLGGHVAAPSGQGSQPAGPQIRADTTRSSG